MSGGTCLLFKIKHGSSVHLCATASFMLFSQPKIILFEDFIISLINELYFYIFIIYYNVCFSAFKTKKIKIVCHVAASPSSQQNINGSRLESID